MGLASFWNRKTEQRQLGLYLAANRCWVMAADKPDEQALELPLTGESWPELLEAIVDHFGPARLAVVLGSGRYQLLLSDKPSVPPQEMADAIRWSIKDMVVEPVTNLKVDYFEPPQASTNKVTVVAVSLAMLRDFVHAADTVGCKVAGIGIEELVTARLFPADEQARMVVSHVTGGDLLLTVIKQGALWMQRRVRGFAELERIDADTLAMGVADSLSLELQRSMDFFESQLRQPPVARIELLTQGAVETLARLLDANFNQPVSVIPSQSVEHTFARLACREYLETSR